MAVACALVLTGCPGQCVRPDAPKVVRVAVDSYPAVAASLTDPLPIAEPRDHTVGECPRVARARKAQLERCNAGRKELRDRSNDAEGAPGQ